MTRYWRSFRVEIIWILLLLALALAMPGKAHGNGDDCVNIETFPPCDAGCGDCFVFADVF